QFHEERSPGGEYIPLRNRRPSVRYGLSRVVVEDSVSLLFSEGHFPTIDCADPTIQSVLSDIAKEARLNQVMIEAAICGSVGSVAILMRVLRRRGFFQVLDTTYLVPVWNPQAPDSLLRVTERYKVPGQKLVENGYAVPNPDINYWFERQWDTEYETWFSPIAVHGTGASEVDLA